MVPENFNPAMSNSLYFVRKGLFDKISQYAPSLQGRLLDFGCGAKPYKSLFNHVSEYIGVDYNSEGHTHNNEKIDFYYDGITLPFENESFDCLFSSEVFEHVFNLPQILPEINRVLKPGAKLLITCPFAWEEHEIPVDYARYTRFALTDMLAKNNFRTVTIDKSGDYRTALHQMKIVYLNDYWINHVFFLSRFGLFKKIVRQLLVPFLN